jgi:hypothetical protein
MEDPLNLIHKSWMYSARAGGNPGENACRIRLRVPLVRSGGEFQMFSPAPRFPAGLWSPEFARPLSGGKQGPAGPVALPTSAHFTRLGGRWIGRSGAGGKGGGPVAGCGGAFSLISGLVNLCGSCWWGNRGLGALFPSGIRAFHSPGGPVESAVRAGGKGGGTWAAPGVG